MGVRSTRDDPGWHVCRHIPPCGAEPDGKGSGELGWGPLSSSHQFRHSEEPENFKFHPRLCQGRKTEQSGLNSYLHL